MSVLHYIFLFSLETLLGLVNDDSKNIWKGGVICWHQNMTFLASFNEK